MLGIHSRKKLGNIAVIANMRSGQATEQRQKAILSSLHKKGIAPDEVLLVDTPESTVKRTRECAEQKCGLIIGVGGDGTLNTIINGLAGSETALGVIPTGTANVLANSLGVTSNIEQACSVIAKGTRRRIDLGRMGKRYFACNSGVGFDAYVLKNVDSHSKKRFGLMAYIGMAVRKFFTYGFRTVRVSLGSGEKYRGYMVLINNTKYYGGNFQFTPQADASDGLLDVVIFKRKDPGTVLRYLNSIRTGTIADQSDVVYAQVPRLHVYRHGRHPIHIDGEYYRRSPASYSVAPNSLTVLVNPGTEL